MKLLHVYGVCQRTPFQIQLCEKKSKPQYEDVKVFKHLVEHLLCVDWSKRITASRALKHPFITMSHLSKHSGDH